MEAALIFSGVGLSVLITILKNRFKTSKTGTTFMVIGLSFLCGLAYVLLTRFGLWESFLQILVSAGAFYTFILKNIEDMI